MSDVPPAFLLDCSGTTVETALRILGVELSFNDPAQLRRKANKQRDGSSIVPDFQGYGKMVRIRLMYCGENLVREEWPAFVVSRSADREKH